jgi:hypothetical protein
MVDSSVPYWQYIFAVIALPLTVLFAYTGMASGAFITLLASTIAEKIPVIEPVNNHWWREVRNRWLRSARASRESSLPDLARFFVRTVGVLGFTLLFSVSAGFYSGMFALAPYFILRHLTGFPVELGPLPYVMGPVFVVVSVMRAIKYAASPDSGNGSRERPRLNLPPEHVSRQKRIHFARGWYFYLQLHGAVQASTIVGLLIFLVGANENVSSDWSSSPTSTTTDSDLYDLAWLLSFLLTALLWLALRWSIDRSLLPAKLAMDIRRCLVNTGDSGSYATGTKLPDPLGPRRDLLAVVARDLERLGRSVDRKAACLSPLARVIA